jgi:hypothetical protein
MKKSKESPASNPAKTSAVKQAEILRELRCELFENDFAVERALSSRITFSDLIKEIPPQVKDTLRMGVQSLCDPSGFKSNASAVKAFLKLVLSGKALSLDHKASSTANVVNCSLFISLGSFELLFLMIASGEVVLDVEQLGKVFNQASFVMIDAARAVEAARFKGIREIDRGKRRGETIRAGADPVTKKVKRIFKELNLDEEMSERRNALKIQRAWGEKPAPSESTIRRRLHQLWLSRNNFGPGVTKD